MKNYDESVKIYHNPIWLYIFDYPYRILINGGTGSVRTNGILNLIKHEQPDIDKICLYAKDQFKSKHQLVINWREKVGIKDDSETIDSIFENLETTIQQRKERCL